METQALQIAYLAEGRLYVKRGAMASQLIESPFAQGVLDRASQSTERNAWREKGSGSPFGGQMVWGKQLRPADTRLVRITALTRAPHGDAADLLYALDTGAVGGLFTYDIAAESESRLFHKQEFKASDLACHPVKSLMALTIQLEDGTASIAVMAPGNRKLHAVTEGDSLDQAPSWVPTTDAAEREVLVYQSAGLGRNQNGGISGIGPYAIHRLDMDKGQFMTVLEDPKWDYLTPRVRMESGEEKLYFIRRPYKNEGHRPMTPGTLALDILLFPFRLVRAVFAFLNVFSMIFSGKPLTTAGGPKTDPMDSRYMILHGKFIDAQKAIKAAQNGKSVPLVPPSWELMQMDGKGQIASIAKGVLSFDVASDGAIVYTNGSEIFKISSDGQASAIATQKMISQVLAFG